MSEATMHRKIAFVGVGEAKLSAAAVRSALDLAVEASLAALADAGLTSCDVDGVLTASPASIRLPMPISPSRTASAARWLRPAR